MTVAKTEWTWLNALHSFHSSCAATKRFPLISAVGPIGKAEGNYSQSAHFLRFLAMFDSSFIHDAAQQNETQLARTRGRCGFTTWNHLKSTWRGKSYFRRKHSPLIDLTVLWITAVWNMAFKGHISSSLQRCLITVIVGKHKVNLSVIKEEKNKDLQSSYDRCWMGCGYTNVLFWGEGAFLVPSVSTASFSPPHSLPWLYSKNQWLPYSEEGPMSTNEILSAMSHSSEGYWENRRDGPPTLQRLLWSPKHQHSHWVHTNL